MTAQQDAPKQNLAWMKALLAAGPDGIDFQSWSTAAQEEAIGLGHDNSQSPRMPRDIISNLIDSCAAIYKNGVFFPKMAMLGFMIYEIENLLQEEA